MTAMQAEKKQGTVLGFFQEAKDAVVDQIKAAPHAVVRGAAIATSLGVGLYDLAQNGFVRADVMADPATPWATTALVATVSAASYMI